MGIEVGPTGAGGRLAPPVTGAKKAALGGNILFGATIGEGPRARRRERHRAALLAGLACVDLVVLFDEETPEQLIRALAPDVLVKGGDYDPRTMAGADFVRSRGGRVVVIPLLEGLSTTSLLARH